MDNSQSRRQAREQQQKKNTRKWVATGAAAIVLLSGGVVALNHFGSDSSGEATPSSMAVPDECSTTQSVTVETTGSMATVLNQVPVDPESCITLDVTTGKSSGEVLAQATNGNSAANLWIPDSSLRAQLAMSEAGEGLTPVTESLAQTVGVLVSKPDAANVPSWIDVLANGTDVKMGDPKENSGAFSALMSGVAEVSNGTGDAGRLTEGTALRATTIGVDEAAPSSTDLLEQVENGETATAVVTEAEYSRYLAENSGTEVKVSMPSSGSAILDYPMYRTSTNNNTTIDTAAAQISNFMNSDEGKEALATAGLRAAGEEGLTTEGPLGSITPLIPSDPEVLGQTWLSYSLQSAPLNALVVLDASGSMLTPVEGTDQTRMDLTVGSVLAGSQLFPARDSMGLWKFSRDLTSPDGTVADYVELVPMRGFEEVVNGKTQRELLQEAGAGITETIGDSDPTGLHDTLLAAFQSVKEQYEPGAANAVIMLTDGENYDEGSISQEELISSIQAEQDPDNPVFIILIGISEDANMDALETIAASTGGEAYLALSPTDIEQIFTEGLTEIAAAQTEGAGQ